MGIFRKLAFGIYVVFVGGKFVGPVGRAELRRAVTIPLSPAPEQNKSPLLAINSADDQVNPPELAILKQEIKKVPNGRYILLPISDKTTGHGTHSNPALWGINLQELPPLLEKQLPLE